MGDPVNAILKERIHMQRIARENINIPKTNQSNFHEPGLSMKRSLCLYELSVKCFESFVNMYLSSAFGLRSLQNDLFYPLTLSLC